MADFRRSKRVEQRACKENGSKILLMLTDGGVTYPPSTIHATDTNPFFEFAVSADRHGERGVGGLSAGREAGAHRDLFPMPRRDAAERRAAPRDTGAASPTISQSS